jgi:hypothetical protein
MTIKIVVNTIWHLSCPESVLSSKLILTLILQGRKLRHLVACAPRHLGSVLQCSFCTSRSGTQVLLSSQVPDGADGLGTTLFAVRGKSPALGTKAAGALPAVKPTWWTIRSAPITWTPLLASVPALSPPQRGRKYSSPPPAHFLSLGPCHLLPC